MGYFSNYTPDSNPTGLFERSVCGYPSRLETLNYYLDDLTSALETVDQNRPHNQLHPEYDRCFYSSGRYRYYEVLWAEQVSVQDLLAAIAEVQELIRNAEQEAAETVDNNGDIPGQIAMIGFFHPLTFHSRICTIYMLYSLLVGKGIIKDQRIVRGDLDDAVCTSSNTSLFYFIMETWDFGNHDGFRWGIPQEESFRLLSRRKNIYITTMDRAQYEKAQEFDYFKAFFPHTVEIKDLKEEEKVELLKCAAKEYGFTFDAKSFRNSDILKLPYPTLQTQLYSVIQNQLADADNTEFIMHASDFDPLAKKSDKKSNALEELDALIGLDSVKKCVREIVALLKNRGRSALPCLHMVFRGNPGTGKTTVARLVGKLFGEIGIIKDGEKFIETDRDGLVSQYLGGTAAKTASVVKDALGGVLFIDEAYALVSNAAYDYGHEAINTLVKRLEDSRRDFVCIMAGYTNEMNQMLSSNPGLRDRIQFYIDFPDYSAEELVQIYCKYAESEVYQLGADAKVTLRQMAEQIIRNKDENFSNARLIRKVFERTRMKQAMRTSDNMISAEDIQAVFAESDMRALLDSVQVQRRIGFAG